MKTKDLQVIKQTKFTDKSSIINVSVINKETKEVLMKKECINLNVLHNFYDKICDTYKIPYEQLLQQMVTV